MSRWLFRLQDSPELNRYNGDRGKAGLMGRG